MDKQNLIERAEKNLERQLEWISRYDTRVSFVAGISIAMIGFLTSIASEVIVWSFAIKLDFITSGILLFTSLICIYFGQYPKTNSGNPSLLYFGTIGTMDCDKFKKHFKALSNAGYLNDLLSQTHKNSVIITKKFTFLKVALILLLVSVVPWAFAIFLVKTVN